jgi:hypothetical protein
MVKTIVMTMMLLVTIVVAQAEPIVSPGPPMLGAPALPRGSSPCGKIQEQSAQEDIGRAIVEYGPQYYRRICPTQRVQDFLKKRVAVAPGECPAVLWECQIVHTSPKRDVPLCDDPNVLAMYYFMTDYGWDPAKPKHGYMTTQCRPMSTSPAELRAICDDSAGKPQWCDVPELHQTPTLPPPPPLGPPPLGTVP